MENRIDLTTAKAANDSDIVKSTPLSPTLGARAPVAEESPTKLSAMSRICKSEMNITQFSRLSEQRGSEGGWHPGPWDRDRQSGRPFTIQNRPGDHDSKSLDRRRTSEQLGDRDYNRLSPGRGSANPVNPRDYVTSTPVQPGRGWGADVNNKQFQSGNDPPGTGMVTQNGNPGNATPTQSPQQPPHRTRPVSSLGLPAPQPDTSTGPSPAVPPYRQGSKHSSGGIGAYNVSARQTASSLSSNHPDDRPRGWGGGGGGGGGDQSVIPGAGTRRLPARPDGSDGYPPPLKAVHLNSPTDGDSGYNPSHVRSLVQSYQQSVSQPPVPPPRRTRPVSAGPLSTGQASAFRRPQKYSTTTDSAAPQRSASQDEPTKDQARSSSPQTTTQDGKQKKNPIWYEYGCV